MTRPVLHAVSWDEDEPTAPGGGRIRYLVELDGPDLSLGEGSFFVNLSEEARRPNGTVYERDLLILSEVDLTRVIDALTECRVVLGEKKLQAATGWKAPCFLLGSASVEELDLSVRTQNVLKDHSIFTLDDLCSTTHAELTDFGLPKRLHEEIDKELGKVGRQIEVK